MATALKGRTLPRIFTPPLPGRREGKGCVRGCGCGLTQASSHGFAAVKWIQASYGLGLQLRPWQKWLLVHALELDEQLTFYRFRTVLVLVARQNGKTLVKSALSLWRMFEDNAGYLVGTAQDLSQAREVMMEVLIPMILDREHLRDRFLPDADLYDDRRGMIHRSLNDEYFRLDTRWNGRSVRPGTHGPRYLIKALNRKAGRGLANVAEVDIDELREQHDYLGWAAVSKTMMANELGQLWAMSNAGDVRSLPLNHLRGVALSGDDETLFHAEWSGAEGCELDDVGQWAQANPSLGYPGGPTRKSIGSAMRQDPVSVFRTEVLCQFVDTMDRAVDLAAWNAGADPSGGNGDAGRLVICVEAAEEADRLVALGANVSGDGRVRLHVLGVWDSTEAARAGMAELRSVLRPRVIGWFPKGPAARLSAAMRKLGAVEIKGEKVAEACMTFADYVDQRKILHPDDPMLNAHVLRTGMVGTGQMWMFERGSAYDNYATWAAAGAVHLAINEQVPPKRRRTILVPD